MNDNLYIKLPLVVTEVQCKNPSGCKYRDMTKYTKEVEKPQKFRLSTKMEDILYMVTYIKIERYYVYTIYILKTLNLQGNVMIQNENIAIFRCHSYTEDVFTFMEERHCISTATRY